MFDERVQQRCRTGFFLRIFCEERGEGHAEGAPLRGGGERLQREQLAPLSPCGEEGDVGVRQSFAELNRRKRFDAFTPGMGERGGDGGDAGGSDSFGGKGFFANGGLVFFRYRSQRKLRERFVGFPPQHFKEVQLFPSPFRLEIVEGRLVYKIAHQKEAEAGKIPLIRLFPRGVRVHALSVERGVKLAENDSDSEGNSPEAHRQGLREGVG